MPNYRQIHTRMWLSDTWFTSLEPAFKLLFIYLFSNARASACGLYELPIANVSFETGPPIEQVILGFETFTKAGKVRYDPETGVVWIRNMYKYQASSSPKLAARIRADISAVPDCDLKDEALAYLADEAGIQW
jgi:hypothetical protein